MASRILITLVVLLGLGCASNSHETKLETRNPVGESKVADHACCIANYNKMSSTLTKGEGESTTAWLERTDPIVKQWEDNFGYVCDNLGDQQNVGTLVHYRGYPVVDNTTEELRMKTPTGIIIIMKSGSGNPLYDDRPTAIERASFAGIVEETDLAKPSVTVRWGFRFGPARTHWH